MAAMENLSTVPPTKATAYLESLLNKNLRITTTDSRMFWGSFKCTDSECNVVLKNTYEYRPPQPPKPEELATAKSITMDMTSRFLGLVVVPGEHIVKVEVEEFASQMKGVASAAALGTKGSEEGGHSAAPVQPTAS